MVRSHPAREATFSRIIALDVHYASTSALAAAVVFPAWDSATPSEHYITPIAEVAEYQPGSFYLRELPCLLAILKVAGDPIGCIVIDGYVTLGDIQRPGLGWHLWQSLQEKIPVIGVAKTYFEGTPESARLMRGESQKPLFITCAGIDLPTAKDSILRMQGPHRIPTLLKEADRLSRLRGNHWETTGTANAIRSRVSDDHSWD